jgi:hypothetical protein
LSSAEASGAVIDILPSDVLRIKERAAALIEGMPSGEVVAAIHRSFNLVRQDRKRLRAFVSIAILLGCLAVVSVVLAFVARQSAVSANLRHDEALQNQSLYLSDQALKRIGSGDATTALWLAVNALPNGDPLCPVPSTTLAD